MRWGSVEALPKACKGSLNGSRECLISIVFSIENALRLCWGSAESLWREPQGLKRMLGFHYFFNWKCVEAPLRLCRKLATGASTAQENAWFSYFFNWNCVEALLRLCRKLATGASTAQVNDRVFHFFNWKDVEAPLKLCRKLATGASTAQEKVWFSLCFQLKIRWGSVEALPKACKGSLNSSRECLIFIMYRVGLAGRCEPTLKNLTCSTSDLPNNNIFWLFDEGTQWMTATNKIHP